MDVLHEKDVSVAIVVDEYGDGIGALSIDRIFHRMLAPQHDHPEETDDPMAIELIGPEHYRVGGSVSLRSLAKQLGVEERDESIATVAGFIQRHNERLPRMGDQAILGDYQLSVVEEDESGDLRIEIRRSETGGDASGGDGQVFE